MKKNLKIVSLAAAALLAVSPVIASAANVDAASKPATSATTSKKTDNKSDKSKKPSTDSKSTKKTIKPADVTTKPYVVSGNSQVASGSISLKANTVDEIVNEITKKYEVNTNSNTQVSWDKDALRTNILAQLSSADITVNNGSFNAPANSFTLNLTISYGKNNETISFPVTVTAYNAPTDYSANPVITYNGKKYNHSQNITLADNASFNYVKVNGTVDTAAIERAFTAQLSGTDTNTTSVTVDASKVNTAVAGRYPVTVTATNQNNKSTVLTFQLTVGEKGATYKTVNTASPVYSINGNAISQTANNVAAGTSVATFGNPVVLNGVSYTRINGENADEFVLTSAFNAVNNNNSNNNAQTTDKTIMHKAVAYDKDGKKADKTYSFGSKVSVESDKTTINGSSYYKIAGTDYYVKASNIDGTKRTLKKNAYVYRTSTKRAQRRALKKGSKVTTYGGSYKFKNGKRYYRISLGKKFVRTSNF